METKFKIGDVVRMRSGGPLMTVCWAYHVDEQALDTDIPNYKFVKTRWFDTDNNILENRFNTDTLIKA